MIVDNKYTKRPWVPKNTRNRDPDTYIYNTQRWKKLRRYFFSFTENKLCVECKKKEILTRATIADHKTPIADGGAMWDMDNLQGLCASHHSKKTQMEQKQ